MIEKNKIGLSILIPVYNYPINVLWNSLFAVFQSFNNPYEILFLDDCSTDVAIYKVFVEKIVYAELNLRETSLIYDVSLGTINKALNNGIEKFKKIVIEKNLMEGFTDI